MKRPKQHRIDTEAQAVFTAAMPSAWVVDPYPNDYGKDYLVELVDASDDLTGESFIVQLKGKGKLTQRALADSFNHRLELKHVRYYMERCRLPVCLVVADLQSKRAYFVFVQQQVHERYPDKAWASKAEISINLPLQNELSDTAKLVEAYRSAAAFQQTLWPGSLSAAAESERRRLRAIDPRFEPTFTFTEGRLHVAMKAQDVVTGKIVIRGTADRVHQARDELFWRGKPVAFAPGELEITGSPLFEDFTKKPVTLHLQSEASVQLAVRVVGSEGQSLSSLPTFDCNLRGGPLEWEVEAARLGLPFAMSLNAKMKDPTSPSLLAQIRWTTSVESWLGRPIRSLPYFDQFASFVAALQEAHHLDVSVTHLGNHLLRFDSPLPSDRMQEFHKIFHWIGKARQACSHFKIDPVLPDDFLDEHLDDVDELYDLATHGSHDKPGRYTLCFEYGNAEAVAGLGTEFEGSFMVVPNEAEYSFLGAKFPLPGYQVMLHGGDFYRRGQTADGLGQGELKNVRMRTILTSEPLNSLPASSPAVSS